jgi:hypothetical protein
LFRLAVHDLDRQVRARDRRAVAAPRAVLVRAAGDVVAQDVVLDGGGTVVGAGDAAAAPDAGGVAGDEVVGDERGRAVETGDRAAVVASLVKQLVDVAFGLERLVIEDRVICDAGGGPVAKDRAAGAADAPAAEGEAVEAGVAGADDDAAGLSGVERCHERENVASPGGRLEPAVEVHVRLHFELAFGICSSRHEHRVPLRRAGVTGPPQRTSHRRPRLRRGPVARLIASRRLRDVVNGRERFAPDLACSRADGRLGRRRDGCDRKTDESESGAQCRDQRRALRSSGPLSPVLRGEG